MKTWNVRVHPFEGGPSISLGQVHEKNEELARCAALSKFCVDETRDTDAERRGIRLEDDFDVTLSA